MQKDLLYLTSLSINKFNYISSYILLYLFVSALKRAMHIGNAPSIILLHNAQANISAADKDCEITGCGLGTEKPPDPLASSKKNVPINASNFTHPLSSDIRSSIVIAGSCFKTKSMKGRKWEARSLRVSSFNPQHLFSIRSDPLCCIQIILL